MKSKSLSGIGVAGAVIALLVAALAAGAAEDKLEIGQKVPGFELPGVDGKTYKLADLLKGHKAVVVIWIATRCPVSRDYDKRMATLSAQYAEKRIAFIGVNSNNIEPFDEVKAHAEKAGFTFPVVKDDQNKVADQWHAKVTPEAFVVTPDGILRYHGAIDDSQNPDEVKKHYLKNAIEAVLAGEAPDPAETKAFGCTVKRV